MFRGSDEMMSARRRHSSGPSPGNPMMTCPPVISNFIGSWFACYGPSLHEKAGAAATQAGTSVAGEGGAIAALTAAALEEIQRAAQQREQAHAQAIATAQAEQAEAAASISPRFRPR